MSYIYVVCGVGGEVRVECLRGKVVRLYKSDVRGFGEGTSMGVRGCDMTLPKFRCVTRLILNYVCASVFVQITGIYIIYLFRNNGKI